MQNAFSDGNWHHLRVIVDDVEFNESHFAVEILWPPQRSFLQWNNNTTLNETRRCLVPLAGTICDISVSFQDIVRMRTSLDWPRSCLVGDDWQIREFVVHTQYDVILALWSTVRSIVTVMYRFLSSFTEDCCSAALSPIHTADADVTQLDSWVASASAVCIGH